MTLGINGRSKEPHLFDALNEYGCHSPVTMRGCTMINEVPAEERIVVLKRFERYDLSRKDIRYAYKTIMRKRVPSKLKQYHYYEFMEGIPANSDEYAFRLLDFVSTHFVHNGEVSLPPYRRMKDIIDASEKVEGKTNCRGLSIILAELLRMNGIKARHVTCKPYEEPFTDCHVVVDCILPSGQRVMLDPTYDLYLKDDMGMSITYKDTITADEVNFLRASVGFRQIDPDQIELTDAKFNQCEFCGKEKDIKGN